MPITHLFHSAQGDTANATLVQPQRDWNANHVAIDGITTVSANYTALAADELLSCTAGGSGFTITLPTAVGVAGKNYFIKRVDAGVGVITVDGNGAETIDGALTYLLTNQWQYLWIVSDGTQWIVKGQN